MLASLHCWIFSIFFKTTVISLMARYRGGWVRGGGVDGWGGWEAGGGLNPLFGLAMGPKYASHRPKHA